MVFLKKVKLNFVGFWNGFNPETNLLYKIICKYYDVEISEDPDYIICSVFPDKNGHFYPYCKCPQVRIMYSGENFIPDFNLVDYAVSSYPLSLLDRHFSFPVCLNNYGNHFDELWKKERKFDSSILLDKPYFANFIFSHESENGLRGEFYNRLSQYKRIESPGSFLNNIRLDYPISFVDNTKIDFQRKSKFTICFESTLHEGFVTEKITDAFLADTIPIYFGSSTVKEIFNEDAFLYCSDKIEFDELINRIIELDCNDQEYIKMLNQPVFNKTFDYEKKYKELESFIIHIFEQPIEKVVRRSVVYAPARHNDYLQKTLLIHENKKKKRCRFLFG